MSRSFQRGFTMVEVIVSMGLVALTMATLVALFSGGMRIWQRSECGARQDQALYIAFDKMRRDLHHIQPFAKIPFKGARQAMEFPVLTDSGQYTQTVLEPGKKSFFYDKKTKTLCESEEPYRGMKRYSERVCRAVLERVEKVQFNYLAYNANSESLSWSGQWTGSSFPVSIKMELEYVDLCSEQKEKKQFTISIPIGPIR